MAARGLLAPRAHEQMALLVLLSDDADAEVAGAVNATIGKLPGPALTAFLARSDVPGEMRAFFSARGIEPSRHASAEETSQPLVDALTEMPQAPKGADIEEQSRLMSALPLADRLKLAMKGSREQRSQLIRDPNKMVSTVVLSSPKLTDAEVESFARMANVSEDVLRIIGSNRSWLKNYGVVLGLTRNPRTPPALSMQFLHRLTEKDVKMVSIDRNVPDSLRIAARRLMLKQLK